METPDLFKNEKTAAYGEKLVDYQFNGKDIFVISDLHMSTGINSTGNYEGTENFFADQSFGRFIDHIINNTINNPALLVINGDLVDFLRIDAIPESEQDFLDWNEALSMIGINKTISDLKGSIDKKERKFGLKTDDYKSVWKLYLCATGHKKVFESLAKWLSNGHELIITKGNHDLEWYWKPVRDYMQYLLAGQIAAANKSSINAELVKTVAPNLTFIDDNLIVNETIYIEHGHHYENFTRVYGPAVLKDCNELNLPFGSFFNRYLVNKIELAFPYIDDVRPRENILSVLIQERFPLAIKMLFYYLPLIILIIPKRQYKYALRYLFQFLLFIVLPVAITIVAFLIVHPVKIAVHSPTGIIKTLLNSLENLGFLILSYLLSRLFAMLQLTPPDGLFKNAQAVFDKHPGVQVVTFGHTHDPEQKDNRYKTKRYYNTGTWIPVFETDAADIRLDKTYTFLRLVQNRPGEVAKTALMRWNDDALRIDALTLMDRKYS
ncbi:MAG TPA: metallophosphoesterase [Mucilaginibacter sp.]